MLPGSGYGDVEDDELELLLFEEEELLLLDEELELLEELDEELLLSSLDVELSELELFSSLDSEEELLLLLPLKSKGLKGSSHDERANVNIASRASLLVVFFIRVLLQTHGLLFYLN